MSTSPEPEYKTLFERTVVNARGSELPIWVDEIDGKRGLWINQEETSAETVREMIETLTAALEVLEVHQ